MKVPVRPWRIDKLDETGGYDCMTPGVAVLDGHDKRIFTIDARDFDWPGRCIDPVKMYEHEVECSNIRLKMLDVAQSICVAMNRMPANWGPWT